jgi:hypothetical protein
MGIAVGARAGTVDSTARVPDDREFDGRNAIQGHFKLEA